MSLVQNLKVRDNEVTIVVPLRVLEELYGELEEYKHPKVTFYEDIDKMRAEAEGIRNLCVLSVSAQLAELCRPKYD
jgi:hypothetical protein